MNNVLKGPYSFPHRGSLYTIAVVVEGVRFLTRRQPGITPCEIYARSLEKNLSEKAPKRLSPFVTAKGEVIGALYVNATSRNEPRACEA